MMAGRYQVKQEENGINFQVMPRQFAFNHEVVSRQVGTKPFQCAICNATFEETNSLKLHFTAVHERGIVRGGPAPGVLVTQRPPVVHQRPPTTLPDGKLPLQCPICNRSFTRRGSLNKHIDTVHEGKKPFHCAICRTSFTRRSSLNKHIGTVHTTIPPQPFQCAQCNQRFAEKSGLNSHFSAVHERKKPFKCVTCYASFTRRGSLKKHIDTVHEGKKPFHCTICNTSFTRRTSLKKHVSTVHKNQNNIS